MKKFIPLIALFPLLAGCSSPSINKPKFDSYGNEVTYDSFELALKRFSQELDNKYMGPSASSSTGNYLKTNVVVNTIASSKNKSEKLDDNKKVTGYSQSELSLKIDVRNKRFSSSGTSKTFYDGDTSLLFSSSGIAKKSETRSRTYGELIAGVFCQANLEEGTYTQTTLSSSTDFGLYVLSMGFPISSIISQFSYYYSGNNSSFYINNDILTVVEKSARSGIIQETVLQLKSKSDVTIKYKMTMFSESDVYKNSIESYSELTLKSTNETVKRFDYSSFSYSVQ